MGVVEVSPALGASAAARPGAWHEASVLPAGLREFPQAAASLAEVADLPLAKPLAPRLYDVVNDLHARQVEIVTLDTLGRYDLGYTPQALAKALRSRGWLYPLRTRGAWSVPFNSPGPHVGRFRELEARLAVRPDTPVCLAGLFAAHERGYLARPTEPCIGYPPGLKVPRCLDGFPVLRWRPRVPPEKIGGLPVWSDETLLAFMAATPARMPWDDIADWLPEMCDNIIPALVVAELAGRGRAVWMKTAFLAERGERADVADAVLAAAPAGSGPYIFGHRQRQRGRFRRPPQWVPKFEVMDYLLATRWNPKWL